MLTSNLLRYRIDNAHGLAYQTFMPFITKANASELAAKGNAVRWSQENREAMKSKPILVVAPVALPVLAQSLVDDGFKAELLVRTRKQITAVMDMMFEEEDPAKIDRLAAALSRLEVIEQKLSMRHAPAAEKREKPDKSRYVQAEPEETPQVQAPVTPVQPEAGLA